MTLVFDSALPQYEANVLDTILATATVSAQSNPADYRSTGGGVGRGMGFGVAESWKNALITDIESGFIEGIQARLVSAVDPDYDVFGKWPELETFRAADG